jgi:hypothetical protein
MKAAALAFVLALGRAIVNEAVCRTGVRRLCVARREFQQSIVGEMFQDIWKVIHRDNVFRHHLLLCLMTRCFACDLTTMSILAILIEQ